MFINSVLEYPVLVIASIGKKSFEAMGKIINRSGDSIKRLLCPADKSFFLMHKIASEVFKDKKRLTIVIDDTLVKKFFARYMRGACLFYDTKIGRRIMAYRLLVAAISDGKYTIPIRCAFMFSKEFLANPIESKDDLVKKLIDTIEKVFQDKVFIIAADGAFASIELLRWAVQTGRAFEVRMHSNRAVTYKGRRIAIRDIKELQPKGRQMARTIAVLWHNLQLQITAQRRINKHGEETIVYQAATYEAKPSIHVQVYKTRWNIEKVFRTTKQHLGLQECFSTKIDVQLNHMAATLLTYSIVQWEMKKRKLDTAEKAIRALKKKNVNLIRQRFCSLNQIFGGTCA